MEWKPNRSDNKPIYKQIVEYIESRISNGEYPPGTILPSERVLAKEWEVNRSTVVTAYGELRALGLIISKKGSGTRVSPFMMRNLSGGTPDWNQYVAGGSLLPNVPLIRRIIKETQNNHFVDLATGELSSDLFPQGQFEKIIKNGNYSFHLGYENPQGNLQLREALADHVKKYKNIDATASSILISSGAQQALHLVVQCLLKPGDSVAIEDPSYSYSLPIFKSMGLKIHLLPVDKNGVNPGDIEAIHKKHSLRMVFLNPNFQNPTGSSLHPERRKKILAMSAKYGIPIIEDDPYTLTTFGKKPPPTLKSMDHHGTVLYISSLSKIVSSGLRIGWIIGPQQVINRLSDAKQQIDYGHSVFPQWIASEFLTSPSFHEHIDRLQLELKKRRDSMVSLLKKHLRDQVEFLVPEGGIHMWCKMKAPVDEVKLMEASIYRGVIFMPGSALGTKKGYVRFTFGRANEQMIEDGIVKFSEALNELIDEAQTHK
ncbi:PLP-dependent aminotransferase family protein [Aneurinibacillus tyrosinisolvens]|uniref:MocR-like pyridoxine biosynthesis transcription factor PdxR n=1 Tax=Aneurinibacillus tyrosinisolvens TaxID=1443435 RepID=UPI00063F594E|nr:PLP-dependent aminotransferase family protein [Aneurinibacillus tyrosinisolvens]